MDGVIGVYKSINQLYPVTNESSVSFQANIAFISYMDESLDDKKFRNILSDEGMFNLLNYIHGKEFLLEDLDEY